MLQLSNTTLSWCRKNVVSVFFSPNNTDTEEDGKKLSLHTLTSYSTCGISQTAQRKIREILQQVKQQEQKHQQGTTVSPHHSKWPAGWLQQASANECNPPEGTEIYPDKGWGEWRHAGQTSSTSQNQRTSQGGKQVRAKGRGHCVHCQPCGTRQNGRSIQYKMKKEKNGGNCYHHS